MEREPENEPVPLAVELMASQDRTCVMILVRGNDKIKMSGLIHALEAFSGELRKKFIQSPIDVQTPKIVAP